MVLNTKNKLVSGVKGSLVYYFQHNEGNIFKKNNANPFPGSSDFLSNMTCSAFRLDIMRLSAQLPCHFKDHMDKRIFVPSRA